jgi:hypothetical protein
MTTNCAIRLMTEIDEDMMIKMLKTANQFRPGER